MNERIDSLFRAVSYGTMNCKKNVIADLDVLRAMFDQRDVCLAALKNAEAGLRRAASELGGTGYFDRYADEAAAAIAKAT